MSSPAKTEANRRNSAASTGPRTPEGKAVTAKNALRHGLTSKDILLQDERLEDLEDFRLRLVDELVPVGPLEELLVDRMVSSAWRLRRALAVEAGLFTPPPRTAQDLVIERIESLERKRTPAEVLSHRFGREASRTDAFSKLARYESALERSLFRSLHELQRLQAVRAGERVPPPSALDVDVVGLPENAGTEV